MLKKEKEKEKEKIILNNKIPIKEPEENNAPIIKENIENVPIIKENIENVPIIKEEQNQNQNKMIQENNKENKEIITKNRIISHQKENNSSISNYIFKEDYRIKEDIESNSNFNNLEESVKNQKKKITSQNFSESDFNIEKNENIDMSNKLSNVNMNNINDINNINEQQINNIEPKKENNITKKRKSKFIFKINIKKRLIKLIINKGDDVESKINAFCKENDLDEDDKEEIVQAINANLKI